MMNPSMTTEGLHLQKSSRTLLNQQQVNTFLTQCGLSQYYEVFIEEGFDRPESLMEITETDLIQMEVKRGHRRLLQRAIANARGIPSNVPLNITPIMKPAELTDFNTENKKILQPNEAMDVSLQLLAGSNNSPLSSSATNTSSSSCSSNNNTTPTTNNNNNNNNNNINHNNTINNNNNNTTSTDYFPSAGTMTHSAQSGMSSTEEEAVTSDNVHRLWKRKYHRHAKPDTNAPLKPPSAYVMFSNDVRAELKQQNKSFTDLAKIIGDRWKNITPEEKELYESNALQSREEYLKKLEEYHKTDEYKKYQQYISDFKAENEAAARPVGRPRKRHRRDDYVSDDSTSKQQAMSSQTEDHPRTNSLSSDQRHYPFYLLNEDSTTQQQK